MIWLKTSNLKRTRTKGWKRWYVQFNLNCNKLWIFISDKPDELGGPEQVHRPEPAHPRPGGGPLLRPRDLDRAQMCEYNLRLLLRQTEKLYTFYFPPENVTRILLFSRLLSQPCLMGILKQQLCSQLTANKSKNLGHHVAQTRWEKSHFVSSAATRVWALAIFWLDLSSLGLGSTNDDKSLSEILSAV